MCVFNRLLHLINPHLNLSNREWWGWGGSIWSLSLLLCEAGLRGVHLYSDADLGAWLDLLRLVAQLVHDLPDLVCRGLQILEIPEDDQLGARHDAAEGGCHLAWGDGRLLWGRDDSERC